MKTGSKNTSILGLLQNSEIELKTCPKPKDKLEDFNTGFGENNELHYKPLCSKPKLKVPLYKENYLQEFATEEEKAAARHALGLYNKGDIVGMSLLTTKPTLPSSQDWKQTEIKQMLQGDKFFTPITQFKAVFDSNGTTLETRFNEIQTSLKTQQKEILKITQVSTESSITSLGDVKLFLKGFNNGEVLQDKLGQMDKEMLRFETTGQIKE